MMNKFENMTLEERAKIWSEAIKNENYSYVGLQYGEESLAELTLKDIAKIVDEWYIQRMQYITLKR